MFRVVIDLFSAAHLIDRPRQSISFQDIELAKTISLGIRYKSALLDTSSIPTACDLYLIKLIGGGVTATGRITNIFSNAPISSEYKKWRQQWRAQRLACLTHTHPQRLKQHQSAPPPPATWSHLPNLTCTHWSTCSQLRSRPIRPPKRIFPLSAIKHWWKSAILSSSAK